MTKSAATKLKNNEGKSPERLYTIPYNEIIRNFMELKKEKTHRACTVSIICEGGTKKKYLYAGKVLTGKE